MKHRLTARFVQGAPLPAKGRRDYYDAVKPGLVLRVGASGVKTYSCSYYFKSRKQRITLGRTEHLVLADARELTDEIMRDVSRGIDPKARREAEARAIDEAAKAPSFVELCGEYLERHATVHKRVKGAAEDRRNIENVLKPRWGHLKAADVRRRDVIALLDEYADAGKPYMRNRLQSLISKLFNFGIRRDVVSENPATEIDRMPEQARDRVLSDGELVTLLPHFDAEGLAGLGFRLVLYTAARPGEVFGATWAEMEADVWRIPAQRSKSKREHLVPLSPQGLRILRQLRSTSKKESPHVFPSPTRKDKPYTNYALSYREVKANATKVSEDWRTHDLRRTALTGMQRLGAAPWVCAEIAGHARLEVTEKHYAHHDYRTEARQALEAWGAHLDALEGRESEKVGADLFTTKR